MSNILSEKGRTKGELEALEVAEEAREKEWKQPSFAADLFMGKVRTRSIFPFPMQSEEDKAVGDAYVKKLDDFFSNNYDAHAVDENELIPEESMKSMAALGCFGMKIPQEYGGLGLSQVNYLRALSTVSSHCASAAATLSAHQSIGVPQPLKLFGTEEQKKKYLPLFSAGAVSAFGLTEPDVGSDPAQMSTVATPSEDGSHYVLNGQKLWCTNGAIADVLVVMARTPSIMKNGREKKQITAFIVEKDMPGFEVVHRCRFMGLRGIQNALLKFNNVKVPKENIIWGPGKGLRLALITLNAGRLSLPACCTGFSRRCLEIVRDWGSTRSQWGQPVGKHEATGQKIASISANVFAIESMTMLAGSWVDEKSQDIRLEAAMAKVFGSVRSHIISEETIQVRGGRGYERGSSLKARGEKDYPAERIQRDSRINQIVEGTTEILSLFVAREALDRHLSLAGDLLNPKASIGKKLSTLVKAGLFYSWWFPLQWVQTCWWPCFSYMGKLGRCMRYVVRASKRLARTTFILMLRHGPKLEKRQLQLMRLVEIATDIFAMAATISRAQALKKKPEEFPNAEISAELFCCEARQRIERNFRAICCNSDAVAKRLSRKILNKELKWQEILR